MKKNMLHRFFLIALLLALTVGILAGCGDQAEPGKDSSAPTGQVDPDTLPDADPYVYHNPEIQRAEPDAGFKIDGVLDEEAYKNLNWMWLHNSDGGNDVTIGVTSYFGDRGIYYVYDVTETVPIYVNTKRASTLNSCIEMYLAPNWVTKNNQNGFFEIDLLPTGNMKFKMANSRGDYTDVTTTYDKMAVLGATTKGGEVNTPECYGYNLELFIPWEYMEWLGMDSQTIRDNFTYVNIAHITSNNFNGTNHDIDRYWYHYAQQQGSGFGTVYQFFRFDKDGAQGVVPMNVESADGCTVKMDTTGITGVKTNITVTPEAGKAITSLIIDGEEKIKVANFQEDGSVIYTIRPGSEPITVSAKAEAVGNAPYTVSGQISLHRHTATDKLENISLTYVGPSGEQYIDYTADGTFRLEGLTEGFYTITAEKEGYSKTIRTLKVNRNMDVDVVMEYNQFFVEKGTSWVLDNQNDGVLGRFSGDKAYIMTNDWYGDFTMTGHLHYDPALAEQSSIDAFQAQRAGFRFKFDNGRWLHLDIVFQGDEFFLQYAKHSGANSLTNWNKVGNLNEEQIAALCSPEGLEVKIVRHNDFVSVWANGEPVGQMRNLDDSVYSAKCQVGFESWAANRGMYEVKYDIKPYAEVNLFSAFLPGAQWNSNKMYEGVVASKGAVASNGNGDTGWLYSALQDYAGSTVWIRDLIGGDHDYRFVQRFELANGKRFTITVLHDVGKDRYVLQYMNEGVIKNWSMPYVFNAEQTAKIRQEQRGLAFTVVNVDNFMNVYLDGEQVLSVDVSKEVGTANPGAATGIYNTPATICYRMYGYTNYWVDFPYSFIHRVTKSTINVTGNASAVGSNHLVGETVMIKGNYDYFLHSAIVDGQQILADEDGVVRFIATEQVHNVEAVTEYRPTYWKDSVNFDLSNQYLGEVVLTVPANDDSGYLDSIKDTHRDVSFFVQHVDPANKVKENFRASARFNFTNGKDVWLSILHQPEDGNNNRYIVQTMTASITPSWKKLHTLTAEEAAAIQAGATMRIFIVGNDAVVQLNGKELCVLDLSAGNVAGVGAQVRARFYGNGKQVLPMQFTLGGEPTVYKLVDNTKLCGSVTANQKYFNPGDDMVLTIKLNSGFVDPVLKVNDEVVQPVDGQYTVKNVNADVTVELTATQTEDFMPSADWDLSQQKQGILTYTKPDGDSGYVTTYQNGYRDITITVAAPTDNVAKESFSTQFRLDMSGGKRIVFRVLNDANADGTAFRYQIVGDANNLLGANKWSNIAYFSDAENALANSGAPMTYRFALEGNNGVFFVNGKRVKTWDLSAANVAEQTFKANIRIYTKGTVNNPITLEYKLNAETLTGVLNLVQPEDGTLTASQVNYILGETITVTAAPTTANPLRWVKLDNVETKTDANGSFSFTATQPEHTVTANFIPDPVWVTTNAEWDVTQQKFNKLTIKGTDGDSNWLDTVKNTYREATIHYTNVKKDTFENALAFELQFTGGKIARFRLISDNKDDLTIFRLQNMGASSNMISTKWPNIFTLNAAQNQKLVNEGIDITVSALGNDLVFYVDGVRVGRYDLSAHGIADQTFKVRLRSYNTSGVQTPVTFALSETASVGKLDVSAVNGSVTCSPANFKVGETVTLTLNNNDGYALKSLSIDGTEVEVTGTTYTLNTTKATHKVEAVFSITTKTWSEANNWDVSNQDLGQISVTQPAPKSNGESDSGYLTSINSNLRDMSVTVAHAAPASSGSIAVQFRLDMSGGKRIVFRVINDENGGLGYRYQLVGDANNLLGENKWSNIARFSDAENALASSGAPMTYRFALDGNNALFFVNGRRVKTWDLSAANVAEQTFQAKIRIYTINHQPTLNMNFGVATQTIHGQFASDPLTDFNNASVVHPDGYVTGELVTVKVVPTGYLFCKELSLDGTPIALNASGEYTFLATKADHKLVANYLPHFETANGEVDFSKQTEGKISIAGSDGDSGWIWTNPTIGNGYNEFSFFIQDFNFEQATNGDDAYRFAFYLNFSNGKQYRGSICNVNAGGTYKVQRMGGTAMSSGGNVIISGWSQPATLAQEHQTKIREEGVLLTVRLEGNKLHYFIDGQLLVTEDLSAGNVAGCTFRPQFRIYGNHGKDMTLEYTLG